jgi:hypothetical protein
MSRALWRRLLAGKASPNLFPLQQAGWPVHLLATGRLLQAASRGPGGCGPSRLGRFRTVPGTVAMAREGHGPAWPIFLRTARTRSLPTDIVGGAQSSAPAIFPDREDAVSPNGPCGRGTVLCARHSCGRRGRRPSPTCRSSQGHPAIGCGCRFRRGARVLPFLADREDAVPPMGPCGRGTVLCA